MKQKKDFVLRQVCGMSIITAEGLKAVDFSKLMHLNDTAAFLWKEAASQGDFTAETLADALCREYNVERDVAEEDCRKIVDSWQKEGLLE